MGTRDDRVARIDDPDRLPLPLDAEGLQRSESDQATVGDEEDRFLGIREQKDCFEAEDAIDEINVGIVSPERALEAAAAGGSGADGGDGSERDSLFREAAEACIQNQNGSTPTGGTPPTRAMSYKVVYEALTDKSK